MSEIRWGDGGPFAIVPEWVLDAEISDRAVRLYGVLARYADRTGKAIPSRKTIAARLRCSLDSLDRAVAELIKVGALAVTKRTRDGNKSHTSNEYELRVGRPSNDVAAPLRPPSRTASATPSRTGAAPINESLKERELNPLAADAAGAVTKKDRPPDILWETLVVIFGASAQGVERGRWNKAVATFRAYQATPESLRAAAAAYPKVFPGATMTALALASNWTTLTASGKTQAELERDALADRIREKEGAAAA